MLFKRNLFFILLGLAFTVGAGNSQGLDEKLILSKLSHSDVLENLQQSLEDLEQEKDSRPKKDYNDAKRNLQRQIRDEKSRMTAATAKVKELLHRVAAGEGIDVQDKEGCTLIMRAADCGNDEIVSLILKDSPAPDLSILDRLGRTAVAHEREGGGSVIIQHLSEMWEDAVSNADEKTAEMLMASGVSPNQLVRGNPPIGLFIKSGNAALVRTMLTFNPRLKVQMTDGTPLLELALRKQNPDIVSALLAAGIPADQAFVNGMHPMEYLMTHCKPEVVKAFIQGAGGAAQRMEMGGVSLMNLAARVAPKEVVQTVAEALPTTINREDSLGDLPLFEAARRGNVEVYDYLVGKGAKVDNTNSAGETTLMHAVLSGKPAMVQHVQEKIAPNRASAKDRAGHDAAFYAQQIKNSEIEQLLKSAPAK